MMFNFIKDTRIIYQEYSLSGLSGYRVKSRVTIWYSQNANFCLETRRQVCHNVGVRVAITYLKEVLQGGVSV